MLMTFLWVHGKASAQLIALKIKLKYHHCYCNLLKAIISVLRSSSIRSGLYEDMTRKIVWKFQINFHERVELEGLSPELWASFKVLNSLFSSISSIWIRLNYFSISVFFVTAWLSEHALRIKGALNIHKCALTEDNPS